MVSKQVETIVGTLILLAIALALVVPIRGFVAGAQNGSTSGESTLLGLIPTIYILGCVAIAAGVIYGQFKG